MRGVSRDMVPVNEVIAVKKGWLAGLIAVMKYRFKIKGAFKNGHVYLVSTDAPWLSRVRLLLASIGVHSSVADGRLCIPACSAYLMQQMLGVFTGGAVFNSLVDKLKSGDSDQGIYLPIVSPGLFNSPILAKLAEDSIYVASVTPETAAGRRWFSVLMSGDSKSEVCFDGIAVRI
jgi:hypothetical protein